MCYLLCRADISFVNLEGADLSFAYLGEAILAGANLSEANLYFADLRLVKSQSFLPLLRIIVADSSGDSFELAEISSC